MYSGTHSFVKCSSCNWSIKSMEQDLFLLSFHSMKRKKKMVLFVCLFFSFLKICYSNLSMIHAIRVVFFFFPLVVFFSPHTHGSVNPSLISHSSENLFLWQKNVCWSIYRSALLEKSREEHNNEKTLTFGQCIFLPLNT